jgi:NAD(P)-dependent dehydrogenase (short-subunit alcohol dehydrogenase family)
MTENRDSIVAVHLKGTFSCVKAALPEMIKQTRSDYHVLASGLIGPNVVGQVYTNVAYNTVKAGILGSTVSLASEQRINESR